MPKYLAVVAIAAMLVLTVGVSGVVTAHHAGSNSLTANIGGPVPPIPPHNIGGPVPPIPPHNIGGPVPPIPPRVMAS